MPYTERLDKRKFDELRPIRAKTGVVPNAEGSALFAFGQTVAIAAILHGVGFGLILTSCMSLLYWFLYKA